jgi:hypothetical protein
MDVDVVGPVIFAVHVHRHDHGADHVEDHDPLNAPARGRCCARATELSAAPTRDRDRRARLIRAIAIAAHGCSVCDPQCDRK